MTKNQINILKRLGFEDTVEDGAILQHRGLNDLGFIWGSDKFNDILDSYEADLVESTMEAVGSKIQEEVYDARYKRHRRKDGKH